MSNPATDPVRANAALAKSARNKARRAPRMKTQAIDYGLLNEVTGFSVKLVWIIGYDMLSRFIDDPSVTPQRFSMLELVGTNPGTAQTQLGSALGLSRPATTLAIDFWQERGCVERRPAPEDRRAFGIHLTEQGEAQLAHLRDCVRKSDAAFTSALSKDEITELRRLLGKIHG